MSYKRKALEDSVTKLVHSFFAPPDQTEFVCSEEDETHTTYWFKFDNGTSLKVVCNYEMHGKCVSLKKIVFI